MLAVYGIIGLTGLSGFPTVVSPTWMAIAFAAIGLHGSFSTRAA